MSCLEWVKPHILVGILGGFGSGSLIHLSGCFLSEQEALGKFIVIAVSIKFPTYFWGWQPGAAMVQLKRELFSIGLPIF